MQHNNYDRPIERNYLQKWRILIPEYEAVEAGRSEVFRRVVDFYRHHGTCSQTFRKYYNRYLASGTEDDCLPHHAVLITPGLRLGSPKNGNISYVGWRLSAISR